MIRLQYIGKQEYPGHEPIRLWNILDETSTYNHSTRSLEGLIELGIVPYNDTTRKLRGVE
jgi:hypothetical protein